MTIKEYKSKPSLCLLITILFSAVSFGVSANNDNVKFVLIKAGQFQMGDLIGKSQEEKELPVHNVKIREFFLSKNEITRGQFSEFVNSSGYVTESESGNAKLKCGSALPNKPSNISWKNPGLPQKDNHPVICVSYIDAMAYINWLSKKDNIQYRLPSEAEWEYAARAGTKTEYSFGNDANQLCKHGNHTQHPDLTCKDKYEFTSPVGSFTPNPWGLNDMHGNVWELTQDCWNVNYNNAPNDGSVWKSGNCKVHVMRGGGWRGYPIVSRSAFRYRTASSAFNLGFRLAYTK